MNQIERLLKYDLTITEEYNGEKGCYSIVTSNGKVPMLDYNKVLYKLNELIDVVNCLEKKVNGIAQS